MKVLDGHVIGGLRGQESIPNENGQWLLGFAVITLDELDRFEPSVAAEDGANSLQDFPVVLVSQIFEEEGLGSPLAARAEAAHHLVGEPPDVNMSILTIDESEGVLFGSLLVVLVASEATIALVGAIHLGVGVEPMVRLGFDGVGGEGGVGQETRPTLLHHLVLAAARLVARHLVDDELLLELLAPDLWVPVCAGRMMVLCGRGKKGRKMLILRGQGKNERKSKERSGFGREDSSPQIRQTRRRRFVRLVAVNSSGSSP